MKISLIGYGKMGRTIEKIALNRRHEIHSVIDLNNVEDIKRLSPENTDAVIEFTQPECAFENLKKCMQQQLAVVCGTTGWTDRKDEIENFCHNYGAAFIYASNFSLGVNILFAINRYLARIMDGQLQYDIAIEEIHHTQKKDAPSGTAITLADHILENLGRKSTWKLIPKLIQTKDIPITAIREEGVTGTHTITYDSDIDRIQLKHTAHSREGFALGAVVAAEWLLHRKKGIYTMQDVLGI